MTASHPRAKECPLCRSRNTRPSQANGSERLLRLLLIRPYRCLKCRFRFWRFR